MKSISAMWFVCKIRREQTQENGQIKKVTEQYVLDGHNFTVVEARILEELSTYISGDCTAVLDISRANFREVFFCEDAAADKWYKAKLALITIDEKTGNEKRTCATYLVQAANLEGAYQNIDRVMEKTMVDYVVVGVNETKVMDVFYTCAS